MREQGGRMEEHGKRLYRKRSAEVRTVEGEVLGPDVATLRLVPEGSGKSKEKVDTDAGDRR